MKESQPTDRPVSIGELADLTGVSRRTVRFYVQRGLIDPPLGLGRTSHYTTVHVKQILRVLALQRGGLQLEEISTLPADELAKDVVVQHYASTTQASGRVPDARMVMRVVLAPGVRLEVDAGIMPPTAEQIQKLTEAAQRILAR